MAIKRVAPNSGATVAVKGHLGEANDEAHDFSAKVECTNGQQIVAERPMYFNYKGAWDGGHDVIGLPEASSSVIPARKTVVAGTGMRKFVDTLPGLGGLRTPTTWGSIYRWRSPIRPPIPAPTTTR